VIANHVPIIKGPGDRSLWALNYLNSNRFFQFAHYYLNERWSENNANEYVQVVRKTLFLALKSLKYLSSLQLLTNDYILKKRLQSANKSKNKEGILSLSCQWWICKDRLNHSLFAKNRVKQGRISSI